MTTVETVATEARDNTAELLALATAARGIAGFAKKHGPRIIAFGTGAMTVLGIGNPSFWHFVGTFFGGH